MSAEERMRRRRALTDPGSVERALQRAVVDAILDHKRTGNSIAVWRDGRVTVVPAIDIALPAVEGA